MKTLCKIRDIYQSIAEFEKRFEQQYDLCLNEGMLLCSLTQSPMLSSGEIAGILGLTASNTSKIIRSVENKGLIERVMGQKDKRQMYFSLTPKGTERISAIKCSTVEIPELLQCIVQK